MNSRVGWLGVLGMQEQKQNCKKSPPLHLCGVLRQLSTKILLLLLRPRQAKSIDLIICSQLLWCSIPIRSVIPSWDSWALVSDRLCMYSFIPSCFVSSAQSNSFLSLLSHPSLFIGGKEVEATISEWARSGSPGQLQGSPVIDGDGYCAWKHGDGSCCFVPSRQLCSTGVWWGGRWVVQEDLGDYVNNAYKLYWTHELSLPLSQHYKTSVNSCIANSAKRVGATERLWHLLSSARRLQSLGFFVQRPTLDTLKLHLEIKTWSTVLLLLIVLHFGCVVEEKSATPQGNFFLNHA